MGGVALMLVFGAMLGKLLDESGAAQAIATRFIDITGQKHIQYAMAITGFLVGIAMHYNAGFLVLIPLVYTVALGTGLPLIYVGLPLASALSVTHGFTPPHPAPTFLALLYKANINQTLLVGIIAALPAALLGGVLFSRTLKIRDLTPPVGLARTTPFERHELPGFTISLVTALVPVILMLTNALVDISLGTATIDPTKPDYAQQLAAVVHEPALRLLVTALKFFGNPNVALMLAVLFALYALGVRRGRSMDSLMRSVQGGVATMARSRRCCATAAWRTTSRARRRDSTSIR
jgi:H+/gluconate symporter-like permease